MPEEGKRLRLAHYMRQTATLSVRDDTYKNVWRNNANKVEAFEKYIGLELHTESFSKLITEAYVHFIQSSAFGYKVSTVQGFLFRLKEAIEQAAKDGYPIHAGCFDVSIAPEDSFSIALTEQEIQSIFYLKGLRGAAHAIRERFVIGCCTGLRYSDLAKIKASDFGGQHYKRRVQKGKRQVIIPVHWMIKEILKRNNGQIPPIPTSQSFSGTIKRVCRKAGIVEKVLYEQTHGLTFVRKRIPKYQLVSPHTARRSLATNMYLAGIPVKRIMLITGHKTEEAFFRYIRIQPLENAIELNNHPYFTGKEKVIDGKSCPHCHKEIGIWPQKKAV